MSPHVTLKSTDVQETSSAFYFWPNPVESAHSLSTVSCQIPSAAVKSSTWLHQDLFGVMTHCVISKRSIWACNLFFSVRLKQDFCSLALITAIQGFFFNLLECMMLDFAFSYFNLVIRSPITSCLLSYIWSVFKLYVHLCLFSAPTLSKCLSGLQGSKWRQLDLMFVHSVQVSSMQQSHYNSHTVIPEQMGIVLYDLYQSTLRKTINTALMTIKQLHLLNE